MNKLAKTRLKWIRYFEQVGNLSLASRRCGVSRYTLRKWLKLYHMHGVSALEGKSPRPHNSPNRKITSQEEDWILELRAKRQEGHNTHHASVEKVSGRAEIKVFR